ncbi:MAG: PilZ domain-containing protein [Pirellulaceae bacterium]
MKRKLRSRSPDSREDDAREAAERREWARYRSDLQRVVVLGPPAQVASIVDESFGGIGIVVRNVRGLSVNQPITLLYSDAPMVGTVRRIEPTFYDAFQIGVQWVNAATGRQSTAGPLVLRDSAHFLCLQQSLKLVCDLIGVDEQEEELSCVRLPGGAELCCSPEHVTTVSLYERRAELLAMGSATTMLLGLYQLGERETQESAIDTILSFEFSYHEQ